jgi:hypothetical protein
VQSFGNQVVCYPHSTYMAGWFLDIFIEYVFRMFVRAMKLLRSRSWPVVKATLLIAECPQAVYGCDVATVYYGYVVNGEKYGSAYDKPFISHDSGVGYCNQFVKGMDFKVRVKPDNPSVSVPIE